MTLGREFLKALWQNNAVFRLLLGLCPALAVTTSAENGLGGACHDLRPGLLEYCRIVSA